MLHLTFLDMAKLFSLGTVYTLVKDENIVTGVCFELKEYNDLTVISLQAIDLNKLVVVVE